MFTIYITEDVFNGILSHAKQYGENEVIGKLVGRPYKHPTVDYRFVDIWGHVPVESISTPVSVKYSPGAAEDLGEDLLIDYDEAAENSSYCLDMLNEALMRQSTAKTLIEAFRLFLLKIYTCYLKD